MLPLSIDKHLTAGESLPGIAIVGGTRKIAVIQQGGTRVHECIHRRKIGVRPLVMRRILTQEDVTKILG